MLPSKGINYTSDNEAESGASDSERKNALETPKKSRNEVQ